MNAKLQCSPCFPPSLFFSIHGFVSVFCDVLCEITSVYLLGQCDLVIVYRVVELGGGRRVKDRGMMGKIEGRR